MWDSGWGAAVAGTESEGRRDRDGWVDGDAGKTFTATLSQRARKEEAGGVWCVADCLAWVVGVAATLIPAFSLKGEVGRAASAGWSARVRRRVLGRCGREGRGSRFLSGLLGNEGMAAWVTGTEAGCRWVAA